MRFPRNVRAAARHAIHSPRGSHMQNAVQRSFSTVLRPLHLLMCAMVIIAGSHAAPTVAQGTAATSDTGGSKLSATVQTLQKNDVKQGTGAEAVPGKAV